MATRLFFAIIFVLVGAIVPTLTSGKDIIVGDEAGWRLGFDYQAWAKTKDFRLGDRLVFHYTPGVHTVIRVNLTNFVQCIKEPRSNTLTSGYDIVQLDSVGRRWYVCGVGKHCENGLKLALKVLPKY